MLNSMKLASNLGWREWRHGEWVIIFLSLILAISAITAVHFYTDRLMRALDQQGAKFLGGNLVVSTPTPIPREWKQKSSEFGLKNAEVWAYPSVATVGEKFQLVNIQAVSKSYPLLGSDKIHLNSSEAWTDKRLLELLSIQLNSEITIGSKKLILKKILSSDMDALNTGWSIAPKLMMLLDDVPATRTVVPGSRVDYRLLLAGDAKQLLKFNEWIKPQLKPGQQIIDAHNQSLTLGSILERTQQYLQLTLLVCLLMSGIAIALSVEQYLRRHKSHVALWRCLGANRKQIISIFVWQLSIVAFIAGIAGVILGYLAQNMFSYLFQEILPFALPAPSFSPVILGFSCSVFLLFAFSSPIFVELPRISPLLIWRNEGLAAFLPKSIYAALSMIIISLFVYAFMSPTLLTVYIAVMIILSIMILYTICLGLLAMIRYMATKTEGYTRRGLNQLVQYPKNVSLQFISFSMILIFLLLLAVLRVDLIHKWNLLLPINTPNYFIFNMAADDLEKLKQLLEHEKIAIDGIYPMTRGRLTEINHQPVMDVVPKSALNNNALHRELNLSWMFKTPSDNKIIAGEIIKITDKGKSLVSVENKLAEDLGIKLGDTLTFLIGDHRVTAEVYNLRSVNWTSFHPNFYMIFPPGILNSMPHTYITSIYIANDKSAIINTMLHTFPNITVLDVTNLLAQLQILLAKVVIAMQYMFLFSLALSVIIFIACYQASKDERKKTYYLLHVLGASRGYIWKSTMVEYGILSLSILAISFLLAYGVIYAIELYVFEM